MSQPTQEARASAKQHELSTSARCRSSVRRIVRVSARWVLLLSFAWWSATLVWESWSGALPRDIVERIEAASSTASDDLLTIDFDEVEPALPGDFLPASVDGWTVQGVQRVPGAGDDLFEGSYIPTDEERNLVRPLVVYVQTGLVAQRDRDGAMRVGEGSRYTVEPTTLAIDDVNVLGAASVDGVSYAVSWEDSDRFYVVDATFRFEVHKATDSTVLQAAAAEIARSVVAHRRAGGTN